MRCRSSVLLAMGLGLASASAFAGQQPFQPVLPLPPAQSPQQSLGQALGVLPPQPSAAAARQQELVPAQGASAESPRRAVRAPPPVARKQSDPPAITDAGTIGVMAQGAGDQDRAIPADLAGLFDQPSDLRIVGLAGNGTVRNIHDLVHEKGVDVAVVNADALDIVGKSAATPDIGQKIAYLVRLQDKAMHVFAPMAITDIRQLAGKTVGLSQAGASDAASTANVFDHLGVTARFANFAGGEAGDKLKAGAIDAAVFWGADPDPTLAGFGNDGRFHLLAVPYDKSLQDVYYPASVAADAYPGLAPAGQKVETISVSAVLATYNWQRGGERYQKVARFTQRFLQRFAQLQNPGHDAAWKSINPYAIAQGWKRFPAAQEWVDANVAHAANEPAHAEPNISEFQAFLDDQSKSAASGPGETQKLFEQFLAWRKTRATALPAK